MKRRLIVGLVAVVLVGIAYAAGWGNRLLIKLGGGSTVSERVAQYGPAVADRLRPAFAAVGAPYPPARIQLAAFKAEKRLDLYAPSARGAWVRVKSYPILGASGTLGPKLREGDHQVPEGIYEIDRLNPNSSFNLSLHVNYPNAFDRGQAKADGRTKLGGDIFIHGGRSSVGCLAMGDDAIEELFVLVASTERQNATIIITPIDFREHAEFVNPPGSPGWAPKLYANLRAMLEILP